MFLPQSIPLKFTKTKEVHEEENDGVALFYVQHILVSIHIFTWTLYVAALCRVLGLTTFRQFAHMEQKTFTDTDSSVSPEFEWFPPVSCHPLEFRWLPSARPRHESVLPHTNTTFTHRQSRPNKVSYCVKSRAHTARGCVQNSRLMFILMVALGIGKVPKRYCGHMWKYAFGFTVAELQSRLDKWMQSQTENMWTTSGASQ